MKELHRKVSNLIFDLEMKVTALNALWIEETEKICRAARKEFTDHRSSSIKLNTSLVREVQGVNEIIHSHNRDEDAQR